MSEYEKKDNSGALFKNDKKESDSHPDYKGSAMIDGSEYWVNGWINTSKAGTKYMKFSYSPKEQAHANGLYQVQQAMAPKIEPLSEDDIPF